jgi:selenophosphate synthetase-related protein
LITVRAEDVEPVATVFKGLACRCVGRVTAETRLRVRRGESIWLDVDAATLEAAYRETLADV